MFFEVSVCLKCFGLFWGLDVDPLEWGPFGARWCNPHEIRHLFVVEFE